MTSPRKEEIRIALAQINPTMGDLRANAEKIIAFANKAERCGADIVSFPELAVTGYPPEDLLLRPKFVADNIAELKRLAKAIGSVVAVVGFVDSIKDTQYNAAALIYDGKIRGMYHKAFLPNYGVFDEKRYFAPGKEFPIFGVGKTSFGVNICEDIWHLNGPAGLQALKGARLIVNVNASPYHLGKGNLRQQILKQQAKKYKVFISYVNIVGGQDELVFDGQSMVIDDQGRVMAQAKSFEEDLLVADLELLPAAKKPRFILRESIGSKPLLPKKSSTKTTDEVAEVYEALVLGLGDYIRKNGFKKVVLGLSGGIDSSLVAAIAADSVGRENVMGVLMSSAYTSSASVEDAQALARNLGIKSQTIPIQGIFDQYLSTLAPAFKGSAASIAEENIQARIRGNILMALSNKFGCLALNTGNKSEVSCGYCTLYGDMAGGFGVLKDVPKTLVYRLAEYKNAKEHKELIPRRVFEKAPTAELKPNQKDSDTLPEYDLLDRILKLYVEEDKGVAQIVKAGIPQETVKRVIHMVDRNEYKRRQAPPGIKITPKAFGRDRRMPITNRYW
ncbi:MAG: NAD+ synthase [Candidatus Omnitrophota bacterium]